MVTQTAAGRALRELLVLSSVLNAGFPPFESPTHKINTFYDFLYAIPILSPFLFMPSLYSFFFNSQDFLSPLIFWPLTREIIIMSKIDYVNDYYNNNDIIYKGVHD